MNIHFQGMYPAQFTSGSPLISFEDWCNKHTNKYTCDNDLKANLVGLQTESGYDVSTEDRGWNIGDVDDLDGSKRCTACGGELG